VLEAGGPDVQPEIADPMGWPLLLGSEVDWSYVTVPQPGMAGSEHPCPRGKVLGGTSCLNGMVWMRGAP
jgi:choline dehydrogenase-like flavoprotein